MVQFIPAPSPKEEIFQSPFEVQTINDNYETIQFLGKGSQGSTYKVNFQGQVVAMKELDISKAGDWKSYDLFEREINTLKSLDHPAIPKYIHHTEGTKTLLFMEFIDGICLNKIKKLEPEQVLDFLTQAQDFLKYLASKSIIHRDIKPSNIFLRNGRYVFVDFGSVTNPLKTRNSTMIGTYFYTPVEALQGRPSSSTDMFSVGVVAIQLLTGKDPESFIYKKNEIDVKSTLSGFPKNLIKCIADMVKYDPDERKMVLPKDMVETKPIVLPAGKDVEEFFLPASGDMKMSAQLIVTGVFIGVCILAMLIVLNTLSYIWHLFF